MRPRGLRHEEHAEDVGLEGAAELLFGDVGDVLVGMLFPGIVDQHVEPAPRPHRSEEHTSELQSLMRISYAVFCLKKKKKQLDTSDTPRRLTIRYHKIDDMYNISVSMKVKQLT